MPGMIPCPSCPQVIEVSAEDPDASLSDLWQHLGTHAWNQDERGALFVRAQREALR